MANVGARTLMRKLQAAYFAIDDVKLYLDTHPKDEKALEYYRRHKELKDKLVREYVAAVGPLTAENVPCDNYWTWAKGPWPWEGEI